MKTTVDPLTIPRPEPGRPSDSRVDAEYLATRPELAGLPAFEPGRDVDVLDEVEERLRYLHALVAYADPALREDLVTLRDEAQKTLADTAQQREAIEAKTADLLAAAPLLPDAQAAAAARPDAQAAAAALPAARAAAALLPDVQSALTALGAIPTALSGLRVTPADGGYLFEAAAAATTPATVQAAPLGGLLYEVI